MLCFMTDNNFLSGKWLSNIEGDYGELQFYTRPTLQMLGSAWGIGKHVLALKI